MSLRTTAVLGGVALIWAACSTLPDPVVKKHSFPADVFIDEPGKPFEAIGRVRTKVEWQSLNPTQDEDKLCTNYYNKAAADLLKRSRAKGGDAVIGLRTVTFLIDGRVETHKTPQCSDDGQEGQVLAEGIAVRWKKLEVELEPTRGKLRPAARVPKPVAKPRLTDEDLPPPKPRQSARPVPQRASPADTVYSSPSR